MPTLSPHLIAMFQALFVTFLWSTSWVLIKIGLRDLPALPFAGLRYSLAFVMLLPLILRPPQRAILRSLTRRDWLRLAGLGLLYYSVAQGTQFVSLALLPAMTSSLILNFTPLIVALLGVLFLAERPTLLQWGGVGLLAIGVAVYFQPAALPDAQVLGIVVTIIGMGANAGGAVLGRHINRAKALPPLIVTGVSMGIGSAPLLLSGFVVQGFPALNLTHLVILGWLALINTAFAFTLWNRTLRTLPAVESSIINSSMLVQIALLA